MLPNELKFYEYDGVYGKYYLTPTLDMYYNNHNLYLGFHHYDEKEDFLEPFCCATVNVIPLAYLEAAIDTNDNGPGFVDFLEDNGFGKRTPFVVSSGFCVYPVFQFHEEKLKEIDPKFFSEYQKSYGLVKKPLAGKISEAKTRTGKESSRDQQKRDVVR